jgi:hypothetical protein
VPAPVFADIVVGELDQLIAVKGNNDSSWQTIIALPATHPLRRIFMALASGTQVDLPGAAASLEAWFNDAMDRVSGWYRRGARITLLPIAVVVVAVLNLDSVALIQRIWSDEATRTAITDVADDLLTEAPPTPTTTPSSDADEVAPGLDEQVDDLQEQIDQIESFGFDIGWSATPDGTEEWLTKVGGLAITFAAIMLGAPFWYDVLQRVSSLRSAGPKPNDDQAGVAEARRPPISG